MSTDRSDPIAQPPPPSPDLASKPDQPRASDTEQDEEERRRAGRGGSGSNPANAGHSLNIRPDVVEGPAGLEVRTTMKSADHRAEAGLEADLAEPARSTREELQEPSREQVAPRDAVDHDGAPPHPRDALEADLLAAANARDDDPQREQVAHRDTSATHDDAPPHPRDALEADLLAAANARDDDPQREQVAQRDTAAYDGAPPHPRDALEADLLAAANADDGDPQRQQAYRQASEESTKRQDAERAARSGEDIPGDTASGATDFLAADIRAAEKAAKLEREGEGQEEASRGQADTGQAAGKGGRRGLFLG